MRKKRCYGWPVGSRCDNKPGSKWGPHWCQSCDEKRIAHLDGQFKKIAKSLEAAP